MFFNAIYHSIYSLAIILALALPSISSATEIYSQRPDIYAIDMHRHNLGPVWEKLKRGHIEAIAEILEMYPDHDIFFLARDAELLYDLAKLALLKEPDRLARIHLLNVSRANMDDLHLQEYLEQHGINETTLANGQNVLFVDTGFAGTIPAKMQTLFPGREANLQTHLICSSNIHHPSTRSFLAAINPAVSNTHPSNMHGTIISYEYLPRYFERSHCYECINTIWEAISKVVPEILEMGTDGVVSRALALKYMEDLKAYAMSEEGQTLLKARRELWGKLRQLLLSKDTAKIKRALQKLLRTNGDQFHEPIVRDFVETVRLHYREYVDLIPTIEQLGLKPEGRMQGNKQALIKRHPEWKLILEDPVNGIQNLIVAGDYQTLRNILDVIVDAEFVTKAFFKMNESFESRFATALEKEKIRVTLISALKKVDNIFYFDQVTSPTLRQDAQIIAAVSAPLVDVKVKPVIEPQNEDEHGGIDDMDEGDDDQDAQTDILIHSIVALNNSKTADPKIHLALVNLIQRENPEGVWRNAAKLLASLKPSLPSVHEALVRAFTLPENQIDIDNDIGNDLVDEIQNVLLAVDLSQSFASPAVHGPLFAALQDMEHPNLRFKTVSVLEACQHIDPRVTPALIERLQKDPDEDVRMDTAAVLANDANALSALSTSLISDASFLVRERCAVALSNSCASNMGVRDLLLGRIQSETNTEVRIAIIRSLSSLVAKGQILGKGILETFLSLLKKDSNFQLREMIAYNLRSWAGTQLETELCAPLAQSCARDTALSVRVAAVWTLAGLKQLEDPQIHRLLVTLLGSNAIEMRKAAMQALEKQYRGTNIEPLLKHIDAIIQRGDLPSKDQLKEVTQVMNLPSRIASYHGLTPLWEASKRGDLQLVTSLLAQGVPVDPVTRSGFTPLAQAVVEGHVDVAQALLGAGANPHQSVGPNSLRELACKCKKQENEVMMLSLIDAAMKDGQGEPAIEKPAEPTPKREAAEREERELEKRAKADPS